MSEQPEPSWRQTVTNLTALTRRTLRASRPLGIVLLCGVVLSPLLQVLFIVAGGRFVGAVPVAVRSGLDSPAGRTVLVRLAMLVALFIGQYVVNLVIEIVAASVGRRVDRQLKVDMADAALRPGSIAHLEDPTILDELAMARGAGMQGFTVGQASDALPHVAVRYLGLVGSIALIVTFRWWLPFVCLAGLIWLRLVMRKHMAVTISAMIDTSGAVRRASYYTDLALRPDTAKENRIFGLGEWLGLRLQRELLDRFRQVWADRSRSRRRLLLPTVCGGAAVAFAEFVVGRAAVNGEIDLARLTVLLSAIGSLMATLNYGNEDLFIEQGLGVLPVLDGLMERLRDGEHRLSGTLPAARLPRSTICFEQVGFRYPGSERDIYAGLDLELRAGESVAIVGVNGAGKTTLIKLLARLYDPTEGRITVDGTDVRDLAPDEWQQRVAAIFQDFTRYELPARDNVAFGAASAVDDDALRTAAERAGALDIIERLPDGWNTPLSRRFSGGIDPSGGQWQRIALARALLAVDQGAGVLVLDEPTANLDVRAEVELYDRFLELTRGVTSVVVSHRFSTVRRADRIVVLDQGAVVEDGDHASLLAAGGHYARMFRLQSSRFHDGPEDGVDDEELEHV